MMSVSKDVQMYTWSALYYRLGTSNRCVSTASLENLINIFSFCPFDYKK